MAFLDFVNTIATKTILPGITDNVLKNDPLLAKLRKERTEPYPGGPSWQENFMYDVVQTTAYDPGDTFDLPMIQTTTGGTVTPRYYETPVVAYIEKIKLEMAGPKAVFGYVDNIMQNAAFSMSATLANDIYRHGQNLSGSDRHTKINGLDEALSDASVSGWDGRTYANYLTVPRSSVNSALNSPMTGPTANVAGPISFPILEQAASSCMLGPEMVDTIITTNLGFSYVKMVFQPQQRFETIDPELGFQSLTFNGAKIMPSQYAPGSRTASTVDTKVGYSATTGETMWFLNTKYLRFYVATDSLFGFGFTGFIPAQNNSVVAGRYHFSGNFTCQAPRLSRELFGITG